MLLISCPWCGPRDESEFSCAGEAHIKRPQNPDSVSDEEWADYLFMRTNPWGDYRELWVHTYGCRRYFNVLRDTLSYEIKTVYKLDEPASGVEQ